ncbi:uncharacterized protein BKA55DRAFT_624530 [Fusarium redolens]|uniref:Uncharacterized protein n=1 Tax=Fusarium redolens TaxID=48865 RepID=A0A9P9G554_FUSRE|nr:uncharacterized protein BKA55DRAFT_624530 [Fusarium redolens]KAH7232235.1 hypothetical protein BKA55DRAFT_624530 [Fusarium redolens]
MSGPIQQYFVQQRLWFLEKLHTGLSSYMIPSAVRLRGTPDLNALETALSAL